MGEKKTVGIWVRLNTENPMLPNMTKYHIEAARKLCAAKGWQVITTYRLTFISGMPVINHAETKRMLEDVKNKRITGLVFPKLTHITRNATELLTIADHFRDHHAHLISLLEPIDASTPTDNLYFKILASIAPMRSN